MKTINRRSFLIKNIVKGAGAAFVLSNYQNNYLQAQRSQEMPLGFQSLASKRYTCKRFSRHIENDG